MFNPFNSDSETELYKQSETQNFGANDLRFLTPTSFQQPRSVRFSARFDFEKRAAPNKFPASSLYQPIRGYTRNTLGDRKLR